MKVVHLSTTTSGGAGRAALRSVDALNLHGVNATLLDRNSELGSLATSHPIRSLLFSKSSTFITGLQSKVFQNGEELLTPLSLDIFAINRARLDYLREFDLIHMHAFFNFFSIRRLHEIIPEVPKVVTLHDERVLTGGCHYATSCQGLEENCARCPKSKNFVRAIVKESKRRDAIFWRKNQLSSIQLILPSEWLQERVRRIASFDYLRTSVINNCVPEVFLSSVKFVSVSRNNELRIAFVSTDLENPYKGLEFFRKAIEQFAITQKLKVTAVLVSSKNKVIHKSHNVVWQQLSPMNDSEYISSLDSVDIVCVPSFIDNSPNVVIEALARGIPVLASESGGTGEIPKKISLPTFRYGSVDGFCAALEKIVKLGTLDSNQREKVRELVSEKTHAKNLIEVYSSLI